MRHHRSGSKPSCDLDHNSEAVLQHCKLFSWTPHLRQTSPLIPAIVTNTLNLLILKYVILKYGGNSRKVTVMFSSLDRVYTNDYVPGHWRTLCNFCSISKFAPGKGFWHQVWLECSCKTYILRLRSLNAFLSEVTKVWLFYDLTGYN